MTSPDNQLTALPEAIGNLAQLQSLNVSYNQLTALPEAIGNLTQLQSLYVSDNQLTFLPEAIGNLAQLQGLHVSSNQLTTLPEAIGNLAQLQSLHVAGNQLTTLPEAIGNLAQLQSLSVSSNQLIALPEATGNLAQLQSLVVDGNQLAALPSHRNLTQLPSRRIPTADSLPARRRQPHLAQTSIFLHNNPALALPVELLGPTWREVVRDKKQPASPAVILDFYFRARVSRPLNEAKLILVGFGSVGKTRVSPD